MSKRKIALLHAKTTRHQKLVNQSQHIIKDALSKALKPYVAFSGGKDSTVAFNLVKEQKPDIVGVWSDDEWYLPETGKYIERVQQKDEIHHIRTNASHAEWFSVRGNWTGIPEYAKSLDYQMVFLGLRQEENSYRKMHLRKFGPLFFAQSDDCWHCNPIHNWSWRDVWAYIYSNDFDYNRAYDRLDEIGIPPERQRIGPLAVERVLGYGQLAILKKGWPDLFNRFATRFPEARSFT